MTKQIEMKYGLCIDWETTGATWGGDSSIDFQGIEVAVIVFNAQTFEPIERLKRYVKFNSSRYKWTTEAESVHGLSRDFLEEHGSSQEDVAIELASLILKYWGPKSKVLFLGHNPKFDINFTNQLLNTIDIEFSVEASGKYTSQIEVFHVILDTSALGFITFGFYKSDLLFEKIGFEKRGKHDAMQDAEQTLETCRVVRSLIEIAMEPTEDYN